MRGRDGSDGETDPSDPPVAAQTPRELAEAATERADSADEPAVAPTEPPSAAEPMAKMRPARPAGVPLAQARMFGQLFGAQSTLGSFGRFRVMERLGAGGMGVVYEAYDPDLARGVALKIVDVTEKDRDSALAEAKALARLSHPNVVPIYDVGVERDHVYLVMELVRGHTLQRWSEGRSAPDILAVYHQAGTALAAAHAAGLVHRDFKPVNAIVGADGRVRVVDFGLACEADDPDSADSARRGIAGTPGFMAPEIAAGAAITPAADQFSFSVALCEALAAASSPAPRRIAAVLERGRAVDPADRFASMAELLNALAVDPATRWRRRSAAVGALAAVGVAMYLVGKLGVEQPDPCDAGAARLDAAWPPSDRGVALDRVAGLGDYGRSLRPVLERGLGAHRDAWAGAFHAACVDRRGGVASTAQVDRRNLCLTRSVDALEAVRDLVARAGPGELSQLPLAVQSMPDPALCSERTTLLDETEPPPPALAAQVAQLRHRISQAQIDVGAGRYEEALWTARFVVAEARGLDYPPVHAEALLVQGHARMMLPDRRGAVPILEEATRIAIASHADAEAVEAWARRAWAQGTSSDPARALDGLDVIEALAQRSSSAWFARALLYNNVGSVELARQHRDRASDYLRRALDESRQVKDDRALELLAIRANIAVLTEDRQAGDAMLVEVAAEQAARLGADHPDTQRITALRGIATLDNLHAALDAFVPACRSYDRQGGLAVRAAPCWNEAGFLYLVRHERDAALDAMQRAVRADPGAADAAGYVSLLGGDSAAAARQYAAALAASPPAPDDRWWDRLWRGKLALGLGQAREASGDLAGAREALETSIAELTSVVRATPLPAYERRIGVAQLELTRVLVATRASAADRNAVATAALAWLTRVAGPPSDILQLGELLRDSAR